MTPPIDPTRWPESKRLFEAALDRPADARSDFLDTACRQPDGEPDVALRAAVQKLLDADSEADGDTDFLDSDAEAEFIPLLNQDAPDASSTLSVAGQQVGPYRLLERVGIDEEV